MTKATKDKNATESVIVKARYWSFVCYPDSAPADWTDRLQMTGLPFCVSPLHDKDMNPDGTPKKAHYHVIICYGGPTTFSNVKSKITEPLGQPHPQYLQSVKGMYRYLTHEDNPEKYHYDTKDIRHFAFSLADYETYSITDEDRCFDALEEIIESAEITELCELRNFLNDNGLIELKSFLRRNTYYIKELLASFRHSEYFEKKRQQAEQEQEEQEAESWKVVTNHKSLYGGGRSNRPQAKPAEKKYRNAIQ